MRRLEVRRHTPAVEVGEVGAQQVLGDPLPAMIRMRRQQAQIGMRLCLRMVPSNRSQSANIAFWARYPRFSTTTPRSCSSCSSLISSPPGGIHTATAHRRRRGRSSRGASHPPRRCANTPGGEPSSHPRGARAVRQTGSSANARVIVSVTGVDVVLGRDPHGTFLLVRVIGMPFSRESVSHPLAVRRAEVAAVRAIVPSIVRVTLAGSRARRVREPRPHRPREGLPPRPRHRRTDGSHGRRRRPPAPDHRA